jgi:hypothetical protein
LGGFWCCPHLDIDHLTTQSKKQYHEQEKNLT